MVIRTNIPDFAPKLLRVVHLPQVHQFMQDDVIAHEGWSLEQTPIQRNRAARRARSPSRFLISDGNPRNGQLMLAGKFQRARGQFCLRQRPHVLFNCRTQIAGRIQCPAGFGTKLNPFAVAGGYRHKLAVEQDFRANRPFPGLPGARGKNIQLTLQPGDLPLRKLPGFGDGTAARHCHARRAIGPQPQNISPGATVVDDGQRNLAPIDRKRFRAKWLRPPQLSGLDFTVEEFFKWLLCLDPSNQRGELKVELHRLSK